MRSLSLWFNTIGSYGDYTNRKVNKINSISSKGKVMVDINITVYNCRFFGKELLPSVQSRLKTFHYSTAFFG